MVADGLTNLLVPATEPTPWLMDSEVAPFTFQARVDEPPEMMDVGVAVKDETTGAFAGATVTVAVPDLVGVATLVAVTT